jgi:uncharacterized membrane protein YraQ (UPF0718 family)/copper chaperone CopZ
VIERYILELWHILLELSPSLLLGLFIAGLMHAYLPEGLIHRGLNRPSLGSVTRASLIGVPLPLCSCGVVPTALGLRKEGASPGATTSFLISTPQTGVDSILVSAAFLGWPFALFKVAAAFVTGIVGGLFVNRFVPAGADSDATDPAAAAAEGRDRGLAGALRYAVFDLLGAIDLWLVAGVLAAALVTTLTPPDFFTGQAWSQDLLGMLVVLAISLPLYVCTTASVPLAASLIAAGMPAGSALVFLMAGPATNVATIGAVYRTLGGRVLILYLGTVVVMSLGLGLLFEQILSGSTAAEPDHAHGAQWPSFLSALVLIGLLLLLALRRLRLRAARPSATDDDGSMILEVSGMTCQHCAASVKQSLEALDTVREASADLASGRVCVRGEGMDPARLAQAVEQAGFSVKSVDGSVSAVDARRSIE